MVAAVGALGEMLALLTAGAVLLICTWSETEFPTFSPSFAVTVQVTYWSRLKFEESSVRNFRRMRRGLKFLRRVLSTGESSSSASEEETEVARDFLSLSKFRNPSRAES